VRQWLGRAKAAAPNVFLGVFGPVYLGVLAALWISAPVSASPAAGLAYAAICFALAGSWLVMALTAGRHPSKNEESVSRAGAYL
jgi:hypothetical protein